MDSRRRLVRRWETGGEAIASSPGAWDPRASGSTAVSSAAETASGRSSSSVSHRYLSNTIWNISHVGGREMRCCTEAPGYALRQRRCTHCITIMKKQHPGATHQTVKDVLAENILWAALEHSIPRLWEHESPCAHRKRPLGLLKKGDHPFMQQQTTDSLKPHLTLPHHQASRPVTRRCPSGNRMWMTGFGESRSLKTPYGMLLKLGTAHYRLTTALPMHPRARHRIRSLFSPSCRR